MGHPQLAAAHTSRRPINRRENIRLWFGNTGRRSILLSASERDLIPPALPKYQNQTCQKPKDKIATWPWREHVWSLQTSICFTEIEINRFLRNGLLFVWKSALADFRISQTCTNLQSLRPNKKHTNINFLMFALFSPICVPVCGGLWVFQLLQSRIKQQYEKIIRRHSPRLSMENRVRLFNANDRRTHHDEFIDLERYLRIRACRGF